MHPSISLKTLFINCRSIAHTIELNLLAINQKEMKNSKCNLIDSKLEEHHHLCGSKHCPGCGRMLQAATKPVIKIKISSCHFFLSFMHVLINHLFLLFLELGWIAGRSEIRPDRSRTYRTFRSKSEGKRRKREMVIVSSTNR